MASKRKTYEIIATGADGGPVCVARYATEEAAMAARSEHKAIAVAYVDGRGHYSTIWSDPKERP